MRILVAGGDGYIGWPLSLNLAWSDKKSEILIVDNGMRRDLSEQFNGANAISIATLEDRINAYRQQSGLDNISHVFMDVTSPKFEQLVQEFSPDVIYHLAQIPSASYSMASADCSIHTIVNNEAANMRLLWAARKHCPAAKIIKLGSFGEYCTAGLEVAEGYFYPEYKGQVSTRKMPYPREADDVYHITKINDSNFVSLACRQWGLNVTDVMQSTVFGAYTSETIAHPDLATRFDYDSYFGTVLNRFVVQALSDQPLTVYGTGHQRTGLMALKDAVQSLTKLAFSESSAGNHRVINHVTEKDYSVLEIGNIVTEVAQKLGKKASLVREQYNPRSEHAAKKPEYEIATHFLDQKNQHTPIREVVEEAFNYISQQSPNIKKDVLVPNQDWSVVEKEVGSPSFDAHDILNKPKRHDQAVR